MYFTGPARQYLSSATLFGIQLPVVALTVLVIAWEVSGEECVNPPSPHTYTKNWTCWSATSQICIYCSGGSGSGGAVLMMKVNGSISTPRGFQVNLSLRNLLNPKPPAKAASSVYKCVTASRSLLMTVNTGSCFAVST